MLGLCCWVDFLQLRWAGATLVSTSGVALHLWWAGPLSSSRCVGFSMQRLSTVAVSGGRSLLVMSGATLFIAVCRLLTAAASLVVEHGLWMRGLSCHGACGILVPWPGIERVSSAAKFLTPGPSGKLRLVSLLYAKHTEMWTCSWFKRKGV